MEPSAVQERCVTAEGPTNVSHKEEEEGGEMTTYMLSGTRKDFWDFSETSS